MPISRLAECILETRADIEAEGLLAPIVGHVGDGNFHVTFLLDPDDPGRDGAGGRGQRPHGATARSPWAAPAPASTAIGYGKIAYLEAEHPEGVVLMRRIKRALDPENIMNPGKVIRLN